MLYDVVGAASDLGNKIEQQNEVETALKSLFNYNFYCNYLSIKFMDGTPPKEHKNVYAKEFFCDFAYTHNGNDHFNETLNEFKDQSINPILRIKPESFNPKDVCDNYKKIKKSEYFYYSVAVDIILRVHYCSYDFFNKHETKLDKSTFIKEINMDSLYRMFWGWNPSRGFYYMDNPLPCDRFVEDLDPVLPF